MNISRLPVCLECISAMQPIRVETCQIGGEGIAALVRAGEIQTCAPCREARPQFDKACSYGSYDGELRELIHWLKYEQVIPAADVLGGMLAVAIAKLEIPQPVLMIPVPLHSSKRRQRRFNRAELLTGAALKRSAVPSAERPQRAENIRGAFRVQHPEKILGRGILLVDDVLTTGTTASERARILRKAGAGKVWVATVARTLKQTGVNFAVEPDFEVAAQAS